MRPSSEGQKPLLVEKNGENIWGQPWAGCLSAVKQNQSGQEQGSGLSDASTHWEVLSQVWDPQSAPSAGSRWQLSLTSSGATLGSARCPWGNYLFTGFHFGSSQQIFTE